MPDENTNQAVAVPEEKPLQIRADLLPERQWAASQISDPLPPALLERVGQLLITEEQAAILTADVPDDEIDVRPEGMIYVSHEFCRRQLNHAFKPLGWTMVEASPFRQGPSKDRSEWYQKWAMLIGGVFAGVSMSAAEYFPDSKRGNLSDTWETIKSDCVRRISKDLGLGLEAWNKRRQKKWRDEYCVQVLCRTKDGNKAQWRRRDSDPFVGWDGKSVELGEVSLQPGQIQKQAGEVRENREKSDSLNAPAASTPPPPKPSAAPNPNNPPRGTPPADAKATMKILPAQERMIFARLRNAQLLVGEDAVPAMEWLNAEMGIEVIQDDGKTSAENLAAMIKTIPASRVTECAKTLDRVAKENTSG
jgi:Mitochondrial genome maintenance MGM101